MSWITVIWSIVASACLTLAALHFVVWWHQRKAWGNLLFSLTAVATAMLGACELWMMRAETPAEFGLALRWIHVPGWVMLLALVGFVRVHLQAGRPWLAWTVCGMRTVSLILNFILSPNLNYREITGLRQVPFLGEAVSVAIGTPSPWMLIGQISLVLMVVFVVDATLTVWRCGRRRQAILIGFGIVFFTGVGTVQVILTMWGILQTPITLSWFYLGIVVGMAYELSDEVLRATKLTQDLRESEQRMDLATEASGCGFWVWEIPGDEIWISDPGRKLYGVSPTERVDFARFTGTLYPPDIEPVRAAVADAFANGGAYFCEHRVLAGDPSPRWIAVRGKTEFSANGTPLRMRGVSIDISARKQAESELHERRGELAHLARVTMLGELSASLAHELNQPLTAILSNAQAAQRFLAMDDPDLTELREILADIVSEDEHAGEVIRRLRLLLRKGEVQQQELDANEIVLDVLKLVRSDLTYHGVIVTTRLAPKLVAIRGDRVQLQQVLLNLIMNACDAMASNDKDDRHLTVVTRAAGDAALRIEVRDVGRGLPEGGPERAFERFFTTKPHGLGLGLSVCRTIITAHGGTLGAANNAHRGTTFHFTLPTWNR